jgi:hypothetical protein
MDLIVHGDVPTSGGVRGRRTPRVLFSFFDGPLDFSAGFAGFDGLAPVV